jgi:DNA-binding NtrC family response regulator
MPRRPRGGLAAWLKETATPLFVVDARRVVLFFNLGCEEVTGWSAADVVGRTCDYATEADPCQIDALTGALCPPPQVFSGRSLTQPVVIPRRDGTTSTAVASFLPLLASSPEDTRVLGVWFPPGTAAPSPGTAAADATQLHAALAALRDELRRHYAVDQVVAHSPAMRRVLTQVQVAAASGASVHLGGPAGSGRQFLARVIHQQSSLRLRPFIPLDCELLTAFELKRTLQKIYEPDLTADPPPPDLRPGGILLREAAQLPRDVQQNLLDWLAAPSTEGDPQVRLFSTSAEPLARAVEDDRLLPELYYRLTAIPIELPALRDRPEDLPLLVQFFVERENRAADRQSAGFSPEAMQLLRQYNWPGNVRELKSVVDEAQEAADEPLIQPADLPFRFRTGLDAQRLPSRRPPRPIDLETHLREVEAQEIRRVLAECRDNRAQAARLLGLTRPKLYRRMEQLGITSPEDEPLAPDGQLPPANPPVGE